MPDAVLRLNSGEMAVAGYGSLISRASMEQTLGRAYDGSFVSCHIEGWRRGWDVAMPNRAFYYVDDGRRVYPERIAYLNVRRDPGRCINAVLFSVPASDLPLFDAREWIYDRASIAADIRGVGVEGGDAVMYVGRDEHLFRAPTDRRITAVRASYLDLVERALDTAGEAFRRDFDASTDPVPRGLVVQDVLDAEAASVR